MDYQKQMHISGAAELSRAEPSTETPGEYSPSSSRRSENDQSIRFYPYVDGARGWVGVAEAAQYNR